MAADFQRPCLFLRGTGFLDQSEITEHGFTVNVLCTGISVCAVFCICLINCVILRISDIPQRRGGLFLILARRFYV